ncbi:hypothetical protein GCM10027047_33430 [Rhodococcus aerolatus]
MADHSDHMTQTEAGRLDLVHRIGAAVVAVVIIAFGVLGLVGGLGFFETTGGPVAGLNSNGLLSIVSLVTGAVLLGSAARGGRTASTVTATIGVLFILSGLVNLALLQTSFNILAFRIPNVFFSLIVGVVLLSVGLYGRVSGGLTQDNPYRQEREAKAAQKHGQDASAGGDAEDDDEAVDPERLEHLHEMERIEIAVAEGRATPEQEKMIDDDLRRRSAEERERAWEHARKTGQDPR